MALSPGALSAFYTLRLGPPQEVRLTSEPGGKRVHFPQPVFVGELPDEFPREADWATSLLLPAVDNCDLVVVASSDAGVLTLDVRYTRREH